MSTRCAAATAAFAVVMPLLSPVRHRPWRRQGVCRRRVEAHGAPTRSHTGVCDDGTLVRSREGSCGRGEFAMFVAADFHTFGGSTIGYARALRLSVVREDPGAAERRRARGS